MGGPNGVWIENQVSDLRVRLMHMDRLAPNIGTGTQVQAGQWVGILGGQGTEEFPHLHISVERLSTGERLDPARFYFRPNADAGLSPVGSAMLALPSADLIGAVRIPASGEVSTASIAGDIVVWSELDGDERRVRGYDSEVDLAFQVGDAAAGEQFAPALGANHLVWVDTRNDWLSGKGTPDASLGDVYVYELATGDERRLTSVPGHYSELVVSGNRVAWVSASGDLQALHVSDLSTGTHDVVDWTIGTISSVSATDNAITYVVQPAGAIRVGARDSPVSSGCRAGDDAVPGSRGAARAGGADGGLGRARRARSRQHDSRAGYAVRRYPGLGRGRGRP